METQNNTNKYSRGKIYKIVCDTTGLIYIGSTIQKYLSSRLSSHTSKYKKYLNNTYPFLTSFKVLENNNFKIILIEKSPCNSKEELEKQERKYIETIDCVNKYVPTRTHNEWRIDNKNLLIEKRKKYYQDNKDKITERNKQYRLKNKDKVLEQQKQYRLKNKDTMKEYQEQYRLDNKDKILEYQKQYGLDNRDKKKEYRKQYYLKNKSK